MDAVSRQSAVAAFLEAGIDPPPSKASMVAALGEARRMVNSIQANPQAVDSWLRGQIKMRGVGGNAAAIAVLEIPGLRDNAERICCEARPEQASLVRRLLESL